MLVRASLLAAGLLLPAALLAVPPAPPPAEPSPDLPDGTDKALKHMAGFKLPPGLKVELFAAEPKLASPVAISVDDKGRVFAAEEYRLGQGAAENRDNPAAKFSFTLTDDLQANTIEDRLALYKKWEHKFPGGWSYFTKRSEQVRRLEDTDGDGKADKSTVFAAGFNHPLDGLAAGVLARDGDVYFTCIPHLWRLRDTNGDGVADEREALLTGFGPNIAFYGHDLHGLTWGPDGKLYFSVGDRGFHVHTKEGTTLSGPRTGAVFRCDADGRNLEVVMRGLRNPQELAFDEHGNLFADDNNCDKGDHARLVYVVDDGDSGWNMAFQTIPAPYMGGPWFAEKMWHLPHAGQPAWLVPPVGKIGTGPSGFLFTSGTTLPDRYKNSFIMCNYAGGRGLEAFKVTPKGAGFEIADYHDFLTPIMATDAEEGPDGKLYVSDFVNLDWGGKSLGGRVYTVSDPEKVKSKDAEEVRKLFSKGFGTLNPEELAKLLGHANQKVRLRAQFTLADRGINADPLKGGQSGVLVLARAAHEGKDRFTRLHGIWGLAQVARKGSKAGTVNAMFRGFFDDKDAEIRAQAAKAAGDASEEEAAPWLVKLLADESPRVRFFAAQSLGKLRHKPAVGSLFDVLAANKDADPWLRHACVAALARIGDADAVAARASDPSSAVRMSVVLALRRLGDKRLSLLLSDADPLVRTEAARAVHDAGIDAALPELAKVLPTLGASAGVDLDPLARRAISAAYRLGTPAHAQTVLDAATNPGLSAAVRAEAVAALRDWADPPPRDRVTGFWKPLEKRDPAAVRTVVEAGLPRLLASASGSLVTDAVGLVGKLGLKADADTFAGWVADSSKDVAARVAALRVLADRKAKQLPATLKVALADAAPLLRAEARDVIASTDAMRGVELLTAALADEKAAVAERQRAVTGLAKAKSPDAAKVLDAWADKLAAGDVPAELRLDVLEAVRAAPSPDRDRLRAKFEATQPPGLHGKFAVSLHGGDAARGRDLFLTHAAAQCVRCHVVAGNGGTAGPDLTKVVERAGPKPREFFLESLLDPSAKIAAGFGTVTVTTIDGRVLSGVLVAESKESLMVQTPDGKKVVVETADVEKRTAATSPMPSVEKSLTPREVRDLVEYLTTLK